MTTDFRALCSELADAYLRLLEHINNSTWLGYEPSDDPLLVRVRAAQAAPEQWPTDEQILAIQDQVVASFPPIHPEAQNLSAIEYARVLEIRKARAVLQLAGRPAVEAAQWPSEAELKTFACQWWHSFGFVKDKATYGWVIDNVAPEHFADFSLDVLARGGRPAVEPVPVSERLPGPEDCDDQGRCWWWIVDQPGELPHWIYCQLEVLSWTNFTAWAPHWALPVPQEGADG